MAHDVAKHPVHHHVQGAHLHACAVQVLAHEIGEAALVHLAERRQEHSSRTAGGVADGARVIADGYVGAHVAQRGGRVVLSHLRRLVGRLHLFLVDGAEEIMDAASGHLLVDGDGPLGEARVEPGVLRPGLTHHARHVEPVRHEIVNVERLDEEIEHVAESVPEILAALPGELR